MSSNQVGYAQKRRSSRIEKAIPLAVQGVDASRAPFREEVTTVAISCHGCSCQLKHEVLPGAMVVLDIGRRANGHSEWPARARVKWIQKLNTATDTAYGIAVEFESAGNIWGISSPPDDWFPLRGSKAVGPPNPGRELRLITRTEPQTVSVRTSGANPDSLLKKSEAAASLSPWFSDVMAGIRNQIQVTVSEIAAATLANERNRLLDEFRIQLRECVDGSLDTYTSCAPLSFPRCHALDTWEAQAGVGSKRLDIRPTGSSQVRQAPRQSMRKLVSESCEGHLRVLGASLQQTSR